MTSGRSARRRSAAGIPADCWYAAAPASAVGRELLPVRAAGRPVVLFRTTTGEAVALEDRCAHRAFPLSEGTLEGDVVRCGLCGFGYDSGGQCVSVPTQSRVPLGACVPAFPVREADGLVWLWLGEAGRARLHRVPDLPWLTGDAWVTVGGDETVAAGFLLLHESFADVTQVPFVAPEIAPAVLRTAPPELSVVVSETSVSLRREFPPARLPAWQSGMLGRPEDEEFEHLQEGHFVSPAAWVDHWDVRSPDGGPWHRLRFTHLVTPVDETTSTLRWRVSRDFAVGDSAATARLGTIFGTYYARVLRAMATAQRVLDVDGPGAEVNVSADVAALKVREIVASMLAEQGEATPHRRGRRVRRP